MNHRHTVAVVLWACFVLIVIVLLLTSCVSKRVIVNGDEFITGDGYMYRESSPGTYVVITQDRNAANTAILDRLIAEEFDCPCIVGWAGQGWIVESYN